MAVRIVCVMSLLILLGCARAEAQPPADTSDQLVAPARDADGVLRVLVIHDMEGLSGQDDPRTFFFGYPELYARGREYLTGDVNAVVAGLFDGGANEVYVVDGHGSGNPEPDILLDKLDRRAQMVSRNEPFDVYMDLAKPGQYDAVAVVGMHAKTGSRGFASHTFTLGIGIELNGRSVTETEFVGFSFGRVGVPVIFASGDDRLAADLRTMPWLKYVTVKTATSASTAVTRPVDEVRKELRTHARRAIEQREDAKAMKIGTPIRAAVRVVPPASLSVLAGVPGIDYENESVRFTANTLEAVNAGVLKLIGVARTNYSSLLVELLRDRPDGQEILSGHGARIAGRWLDYESGRWSPPEPKPPEAAKRYHGSK